MMSEPEDLLELLPPPQGANLIEVYNFHEWLRNQLKMKETEIPALLEKARNQEAILPTYDAIMIDEGQDFEADWLKLLSCCLNPDTQSLLLVEDRAQSIFKRKTSLSQDIGLDFRGRSKVLSIKHAAPPSAQSGHPNNTR